MAGGLVEDSSPDLIEHTSAEVIREPVSGFRRESDALYDRLQNRAMDGLIYNEGLPFCSNSATLRQPRTPHCHGVNDRFSRHAANLCPNDSRQPRRHCAADHDRNPRRHIRWNNLIGAKNLTDLNHSKHHREGESAQCGIGNNSGAFTTNHQRNRNEDSNDIQQRLDKA